jgi:predicted SnoaL-like aldol condensation-catalyzing enzyme
MCDRDPAVGIAATADEEQEQMPNESNRIHAAVSFLRLAASGRVDEAYANYISPTFRHHNPYFAGDAESLEAGMAEAAAKFPGTTLEVQHIFEEGELVAVHSRVRHGPDEPEISVVHIFRFEGDRIAELWDVGQVAPADSPNEYGMF